MSSVAARATAAWVTTLGLGRLPKAPGTFGALGGIPLVWGLAHLSLPARVLVLLGLTLVSTYVADAYLRLHQRRGDPQEIVMDETIGMAIAAVAVPWHPPLVVLAFLLFRVFDIAKPGPVGWADRRLKGAWGIMLDDVIAGLLAAPLVWAAAEYAPGLSP